MSALLEIAVFSLHGAAHAAKAGAHRIELCENAGEGGTTPSYGTLRAVRRMQDIPFFPIIRPRGGDFVYSEAEFETLLDDLRLCRDLGFPGAVTGVLTEEGNIDLVRMQRVMQEAGDMAITFHRAFDRCRNPLQALEELIALGVNRILSSGQTPSLMDGLDLLRDLVERAAGRIIIMPGSGLNSGNIAHVAAATGAREFHTAARKTLLRDQVYTAPGMKETPSFTTVDTDEIGRLLQFVEQLP